MPGDPPLREEVRYQPGMSLEPKGLDPLTGQRRSEPEGKRHGPPVEQNLEFRIGGGVSGLLYGDFQDTDGGGVTTRSLDLHGRPCRDLCRGAQMEVIPAPGRPETARQVRAASLRPGGEILEDLYMAPLETVGEAQGSEEGVETHPCRSTPADALQRQVQG